MSRFNPGLAAAIADARLSMDASRYRVEKLLGAPIEEVLAQAEREYADVQIPSFESLSADLAAGRERQRASDAERITLADLRNRQFQRYLDNARSLIPASQSTDVYDIVDGQAVPADLNTVEPHAPSVSPLLGAEQEAATAGLIGATPGNAFDPARLEAGRTPTLGEVNTATHQQLIQDILAAESDTFFKRSGTTFGASRQAAREAQLSMVPDDQLAAVLASAQAENQQATTQQLANEQPYGPQAIIEEMSPGFSESQTGVPTVPPSSATTMTGAFGQGVAKEIIAPGFNPETAALGYIAGGAIGAAMKRLAPMVERLIARRAVQSVEKAAAAQGEWEAIRQLPDEDEAARRFQALIRELEAPVAPSTAEERARFAAAREAGVQQGLREPLVKPTPPSTEPLAKREPQGTGLERILGETAPSQEGVGSEPLLQYPEATPELAAETAKAAKAQAKFLAESQAARDEARAAEQAAEATQRRLSNRELARIERTAPPQGGVREPQAGATVDELAGQPGTLGPKATTESEFQRAQREILGEATQQGQLTPDQIARLQKAQAAEGQLQAQTEAAKAKTAAAQEQQYRAENRQLRALEKKYTPVQEIPPEGFAPRGPATPPETVSGRPTRMSPERERILQGLVDEGAISEAQAEQVRKGVIDFGETVKEARVRAEVQGPPQPGRVNVQELAEQSIRRSSAPIPNSAVKVKIGPTLRLPGPAQAADDVAKGVAPSGPPPAGPQGATQAQRLAALRGSMGGSGVPLAEELLGKRYLDTLSELSEEGLAVAEAIVRAGKRFVGKRGQIAIRGLGEAAHRLGATTPNQLIKIGAKEEAHALARAVDESHKIGGAITEGMNISLAKAEEAIIKDSGFNRITGKVRAHRQIDREIAAYEMAKTYGGKVPKLSRGAQIYRDTFGKFYEDTGKLSKQRNVRVWDRIKHEWREIQLIGKEGYPRMLTDEALEQFRAKRGELYEEAVKFYKDKRINPNDMIGGFVEAPNGFAPNLQLSRGPALPPHFYEWNISRIAPKWTRGTSKRLADAHWFGPDRVDIAKRIKALPEGSYRNHLTLAMQRHFGEPVLDTNAYRLAQAAQNVAVTTKLSGLWSPLRNSMQGMNDVALYGVKNWLKSLERTATSPESRSFVREMGVMYDHQMMALDLGGIETGSATRMAVKPATWLFGKAEKMNRYNAAGTADFWSQDALAKLVADAKGIKKLRPRVKAKIERYFKNYLGFTDEEYNAFVKRGQFTLEERGFIMRQGTTRTQFSTEISEVPLWMKHKWARPGTQFKKFDYQQARFLNNVILNEARHGNLKPLATLFAAAVGGGELFALIRQGLTGRRRAVKDVDRIIRDRDVGAVWDRVFDDLVTLGTLGLYGEVVEEVSAFKDGRDNRSLAIPVSLNFVNTATEMAKRLAKQGFSTRSAGYEMWRAVRSEIPVVAQVQDVYYNWTDTEKAQRFKEVTSRTEAFRKHMNITREIHDPGPQTPFYREVARAMVREDDAALRKAIKALVEHNKERSDASSAQKKAGLKSALRDRGPVDLKESDLKKFLELEGSDAKEAQQAIDDYAALVRKVMSIYGELSGGPPVGRSEFVKDLVDQGIPLRRANEIWREEQESRRKAG